MYGVVKHWSRALLAAYSFGSASGIRLGHESGSVRKKSKWPSPRSGMVGETLTQEELQAFEREYADPVFRMKVVGWRGSEDAAGPVVRERLVALRHEAELKEGRSLTWEQAGKAPRASTSWGDRLFATLVIVVLGLVVLGGTAFLIEGIKILIHWLTP